MPTAKALLSGILIHLPGTTHQGTTGDVAVDHYHRFLEDVALDGGNGFAKLSLLYFMARLLPTGRGRGE